MNKKNSHNETALDFALALDDVPTAKILLSNPMVEPNESLSYWMPETPNFNRWWYNLRDTKEFGSLNVDRLLKRAMATRIDLEQYTCELKKELAHKSADFDEYTKRSRAECERWRSHYKEKKSQMEGLADQLLSSRKAQRSYKESNKKLTVNLEELSQLVEEKDVQIASLKSALEQKEKQLNEILSNLSMAPPEFSESVLGKQTSPKKKPLTRTRSKKKVNEVSKKLVKMPSKKRVKSKPLKAESEPDVIEKLKSMSLQSDGEDLFASTNFSVKEIYASILSELTKYTTVSRPTNFSSLTDDDIVEILENNSEKPKQSDSVVNSILSDIIYGIEDGLIKNSNELGYHVQTAVQMRFCQAGN